MSLIPIARFRLSCLKNANVLEGVVFLLSNEAKSYKPLLSCSNPKITQPHIYIPRTRAIISACLKISMA